MMRLGPLRLAAWSVRTPVPHRGLAVSWLTRRRLVNIEFHYEPRRGR